MRPTFDLSELKETALLEASRKFLDVIETTEFSGLSRNAKFVAVYMFAQLATGTPNGELKPPSLIPPNPKQPKKGK